MKATKLLIITAWVLALQFPGDVTAQALGVKSYKFTVNGTSSLHDWESSVQKLEANGSFVVSDNALSDLKDVVVKIPVTAIKSAKGKVMDNKTYDAFNHEKNPYIIFTLTAKNINSANSTIRASGNLAMAGVTRPIEVSLNYKLLPDGDLQVTGSRKLLMTEFKMEPPTAMMGAIQVGDEVTVTFDMVLTQTNIIKTTKN